MLRYVGSRAIAVWSAALTVSLATGGATATGSLTEGASSRASTRPISFVPLGSFPRSDAVQLARNIERRLGIKAGVLSSSALPRSAFDRKRKQYVGEALIDLLANRGNADGLRAVLIGLTAEDLYNRDRLDWRFSFSIRHPSGLVVVSRARMDPRLLGLFPDSALRMRRLQ